MFRMAVNLTHAPTPNVEWSRCNVWISVRPSGAPGQAQPTFLVVIPPGSRALEAAPTVIGVSFRLLAAAHVGVWGRNTPIRIGVLRRMRLHSHSPREAKRSSPDVKPFIRFATP